MRSLDIELLLNIAVTFFLHVKRFILVLVLLYVVFIAELAERHGFENLVTYGCEKFWLWRQRTYVLR